MVMIGEEGNVLLCLVLFLANRENGNSRAGGDKSKCVNVLGLLSRYVLGQYP
jgi:hypothetical protein